MRKNLLLSLGLLLATSAGMQAQVVMHEDFSAEQTKQPTEAGYYEYINTNDDAGDMRELQDGALHFYNGLAEGQNWQRAVKFRNLNIKENTTYRVTIRLKGDSQFTLDGSEMFATQTRYALMQGGENLDMGFLAGDGTQYLYDINNISSDGYVTYTAMFHYTNSAAHKAYYAEAYPEKEELPDTYFLTVNIYSPGDFWLDDVLVEEATVQGARFFSDIIRIDFGFPIDKSLLNGAKQVLFPNECVSVKVDGTAADVLTTELQSDGNFYIFLEDELLGEEEVEVSFTNPEDEAHRLMYAQGKAPEGAVFSFSSVKATYDEAIEGPYSYAYKIPTLLEADPENGSFNLPVDKKEFKFKFDKDVDCAKIEATLAGEALTVTPATGYASEITLTRSGADLANGEYNLKVTKIYPTSILSKSMYGEVTLTLNFGPVNNDPNDVAKVIWNDGFSGNDNIPEGWTVYAGGNKKAASESVGSGPRVLEFTSEGDFKNAMYFRTENATEDDGYVQYGIEDAEHVITLEAGKKYNVSYTLANWSGGPFVKTEMFGPDGSLVFSRIDETVLSVPNTSAPTVGAPRYTEKVAPATTGNYSLKWTPVANADGQLGGWLGCLLANVEVKYIPNAAGVEEINLLNTALEEAKAALEANSAERYAGEDYNTLQTTIAEYDGKSFTAPSVYRKGVEALNAATKAMKDHRSLCDTYDPLVDNAKSARDQRTGTKYEKHESYANIEAVIAKYEGKVLTDNTELKDAITELQNTTAAVLNIERVVNTYTAAIKSGLATLKKLGVDKAEVNEAVENAMTDDAEVKALVKTQIYNQVNAILSDPNNKLFSEKIDNETLLNYVDSFDMSVFIENPEIYYQAPEETPGTVNSDNIPGWEITLGTGWSDGLSIHYPWGANGQYKYNAVTCPVADGMIASWAMGYDMMQVIEGLPAGTYNLHVGAGERGGNETPTSYVFANTTEGENQKVVPVIAGSLEPTDNLTIENIVVTDGRLVLGFHMDSTDHTFLNNFHLIMKGIAPGYQYVNGIAEVAGEAKASRTEMYDLNGRRISSTARGIVIVKKTMADGTVKVEKQIVK